MAAPLTGSTRTTFGQELASPPPKRYTEPPSSAAAASCVGCGSWPTGRKRPGGPARIAASDAPPALPPRIISRPPGSATAAALAIARGSEPIRITRSRDVLSVGRTVAPRCGRAAPPAQPATATTRARAAAALATQADPADDPGSLRVRHPARLHRAPLAVGEAAGAAEALAPDPGHPPAADVAAR